MRHGKRLRNGDCNLEDLVKWHCAFAQSFRQGLPFQKLHHQIIGSVLRPNIVEMADVRVVQRRNRSGLALHALLQFGRRGKMRSKNFDRYGSTKADIAGAVHLAHAALA